jgi:hypothetical protein
MLPRPVAKHSQRSVCPQLLRKSKSRVRVKRRRPWPARCGRRILRPRGKAASRRGIFQPIEPWSRLSSCAGRRGRFSCTQPIPGCCVALTLLLELRGLGKVGSTPMGPRSWKGDDDPPDQRRLGARLSVCAGIRRNLYCFSLWLQWWPNRIRGTDESKCDDRGASRQTLRLSRHGHRTFHRAKRHRPDK